MPLRPPIHRPAGWRPSPRAPSFCDPYYKSAEHLAFRAAVLKRDRYHCTDPKCETPGRGSGGRLIADHIVARKDGGGNEVSNGRTLCPACDNRRHREKGLR